MLNHHARSSSQGIEKKGLRSTIKNFAVLGTTGFLGPFLVTSLLQVYPQSEIYCLNRSDDGEQRTISALRNAMGDVSTALPRLHFLVTDITNPSIGLDSTLLISGMSTIDEFIFNAWDSNWAKPLKHFEPFLRAVRGIISFCASAASRPRITFISSICAVGNWQLLHPTQTMVPEEVVWDNASAMPHGYGESKCIAEQLLAKAHEEEGLCVNIVRAGQIGGPQNSKLGTLPRQGWLYSIIKMSEKLGAFPTHVQSLNWIPVDCLAQGIANITKSTPSLQTLQVFNMVHPEPAAWSVFQETLESRFGLFMEATSLSDWLSMIEPQKLTLHGFLVAQGKGREENMSFENRRALTVLPRVATIDIDLLERWLRGWELGCGSLRARM